MKYLPSDIEQIQNPPISLPTIENIDFSHEEVSDDLEGRGDKTLIPSNIIDTRLEVLLGLKLSGHTNTVTEACNLLYGLYKSGEIQNEQQYRYALDNFFYWIKETCR